MNREVAIVCPIAETVPPKTFQSALTLVGYAAMKGIKIVDIGVTERQLIDGARNQLAEAFLGTTTEWIFWMDADMTFPKETLVELFRVAEEKDAKIVTGIYYQRRANNLPVLWSKGVETEEGRIAGMGTKQADENKYAGAFTFPHPNRTEPFKVHAAGFGCILVHRSVFEMLDKPWFKFIENVCSEDFYFLVNAKEKGFDTWAVPTLKLGHIGDAPVITRDDFYKKAHDANINCDALK
jgi:hypothetical protein